MNTIPNLVTVDVDMPGGGRGYRDVDATTNALLEALDEARTSATFFVPRAVAETKASLTRRIAEQGHEVACLTTEQPSKAKPYCVSFTTQLDVTRDAIETATGRRARGHRNAPFAVNYESEWVYDVLVDRGIEYDSSRIPPRHVDFGNVPVPRGAHVVRRWGALLEIPPSTTDVLTVRVRMGTTANVRGLPLPVWGAMVDRRRARGESLVMHLRASDLARGAPFRRSPAVADKRTLERVSRIVGPLGFTSVAAALPELLRKAPIIES